MPTQLNENLSDSLVLADAWQYSFGPGGTINLVLADSLTMSDAWQLMMINPAGSTQGAWSIEIGERLNMQDRFTNPATRLTQVVQELVMQPTDGKARLTQVVQELVMQPTDGRARLTQCVIEVVAQRPAGSFTGTTIFMRIQ